MPYRRVSPPTIDAVTVQNGPLHEAPPMFNPTRSGRFGKSTRTASREAKLNRMSDSDARRQTRAEQALALYEAIEAIATDQEDPRWRQAALLIRQL